MSELDYLELISTLRSEVASYGMGFFSVWCAFVVAIYLVGDKLSKSLAVLLSGIYTYFLAGPVIYLGWATDALNHTVNLYRADFPHIEVESMEGTLALFFSFTYPFAWLLSIAFLLMRRKLIKLN